MEVFEKDISKIHKKLTDYLQHEYSIDWTDDPTNHLAYWQSEIQYFIQRNEEWKKRFPVSDQQRNSNTTFLAQADENFNTKNIPKNNLAQSNIESAQLEITVAQVPPLNEKHFQEDAGSIENLKDHNPQNFPNEIPINENNVEIEEFIQLEEKTQNSDPPLIYDSINQHLNVDEENNLTYLNLSTSLVLKHKKHMFYVPMNFGDVLLDGLVDTGALTSAISQSDLNQISLLSQEAVLNTGPAPAFRIMVANGQLEDPISTVELKFKVADFSFHERFIVMKTLANPLVGLCFLQRNHAIFDTRQGILTFPELSMQLRPGSPSNLRAPTALLAESQFDIQAQTTITVVTKMPHLLDHNASGILVPSAQFEDHDAIFVTSSLSTVRENSLLVQISNTSNSPYTVTSDTHLANFTVMPPEQIKRIKPVDPGTLTFLMDDDEESNTVQFLNELLKVPNSEGDEKDQYWFPTPENPGDPSTYSPIQKRIFDELIELQELDRLNPLKDKESREKFLSNFNWSDSTLNLQERQNIEEILVEFHEVFARHRFDVGINNHFKIKLTPNDERPAYTQSLPTPINLKDELTIELALLHKYDIITTLPYSKYASPIFAQRKPSGKLRLLVDLRKINSLISEDYTNNNHPVSTLTDASQHMADKKLFCKLDCSQAYHCLQMADY